MASTKIGQTVKEHHLAELSSRLKTLECGKVFIRSFIRFQYGNLSRDCKPHVPVFASLARHGIDLTQIEDENNRVLKPFQKGLDREQEKEKDQEKDQEKKEGVQGEIKGKSDIPGSTVLPLALDCEAFREAWIRWLQHLKQKRKPPTIHAQDLQLARMAQIGVPRAISAINHSIERNWQSIYEQQTDSVSGSNHSQSHRRNTGAEQRQVGIPEIKRDLTTGELVELQQQQLRKEREQREQAAKDKVATDQAGA